MKNADCTSLRDAFRAGDLPQGPEVRAHLETCPSCSELFADDARVGRALGDEAAPGALPPELWARTESLLGAETGVRAWLRSRSTWQRVTLVLVTGAVVGAVALRREALVPLVAMESVAWLQLGLYGALTLAGVVVLLRPLGRGAAHGGLRGVLAGSALLLPVLFALAPVHSLHGGHVVAEGELVRRTLGCLVFGFSLGLPFLGVVWLLDRSERLTRSAVVLLATASGLLANIGLALHCPLDERAHLLLGHAPVGLALGLGVFAARRLVRR